MTDRRSQDLPSSIPTRPLDAHLEGALRAIAFSSWEIPTSLEVRHVQWAGHDYPDVLALEILDSGELRLDARVAHTKVDINPSDWPEDEFVAEAPSHGLLRLLSAGSHLTRLALADDGMTVEARLFALAWTALPAAPGGPRLWVSPMKFANESEPVRLRLSRCNMRIRSGKSVRWGWRFATSEGLVFLIPRSHLHRWTIAFETTDGCPPTIDHVTRVTAAIGFALGEPFSTPLLRAVSNDGVTSGLSAMGRIDLRPVKGARLLPSIPLDEPGYLATFVERLVQFMVDRPDSPLLTAIHMSCSALEGFVDLQLLHAWIATELLATWAISHGIMIDGGKRRIADHVGWLAWVKAHRQEIASFALPGKADALVDRVLSSEDDRPTTVQRVFLGENLGWSAEMAQAQLARHGVAHHGSLGGRSASPSTWRESVALADTTRTMLAAVIARMVGYVGPIVDSATPEDANGKLRVPAWWKVEPRISDPEVYEGRP